MEKSPRLKKAAISSSTLCDMAKQLVAPPGLGLLVGATTGDSSEDKKRREEAKEAVEKMCQEREAAQNYVKQFASHIKALLEAGAEADDALADELLGYSRRHLHFFRSSRHHLLATMEDHLLTPKTTMKMLQPRWVPWTLV